MVIKRRYEVSNFLREIGLGARAINCLMGNTRVEDGGRRFDWLRLPTTGTQICRNLAEGCKNREIYKCRNMGKKTAKEVGDCATKYLQGHPGEEELPPALEEDPYALTEDELKLVIEVINRYKGFIDSVSLMPGCGNADGEGLDKVWDRLHAIHGKLIGMMIYGRKEDEQH